MIFFLFQSPKVICWHDANTCKGKVPVDQLPLTSQNLDCLAQCPKKPLNQNDTTRWGKINSKSVSNKSKMQYLEHTKEKKIYSKLTILIDFDPELLQNIVFDFYS